jgi:uncharacterized damage-inducible protein DinB
VTGGPRVQSPPIPRPGPGEYAPFYAGYVAAVPEGDVVEHLAAQAEAMRALLEEVGEARAGHRYAQGKWSVREVVAHVVDAERVFAYRLLRFARADETPLPGFDQNEYAAHSGADGRTLAELADEHAAVRGASLALVRGLPPEAFARGGEASGHRMTVRALVHVIAGHEAHHLRILRERYL